MVLPNKEKMICYLIEVPCPLSTRIENKEKKNINSYDDLRYKMLKVWEDEVKKVITVLVIIGALGNCTEKLNRNLQLVCDLEVEPLQKLCLLGTATII